MSSSEAKEMVTAAILARSPKKKEAAYQKALGNLVIDFSLLHFSLEQYFWQLTGNDTISGVILTRDLPFSALIKKVEAIAKARIKDRTQLKTLISILHDAEKLASGRNDLVHALWVIEDDKPVFCLRRKRVTPDHVAPTLDDIDELLGKILKVTVRFIEFRKETAPSFDKALKGLFELGLGAEDRTT